MSLLPEAASAVQRVGDSVYSRRGEAFDDVADVEEGELSGEY